MMGKVLKKAKRIAQVGIDLAKGDPKSALKKSVLGSQLKKLKKSKGGGSAEVAADVSTEDVDNLTNENEALKQSNLLTSIRNSKKKRLGIINNASGLVSGGQSRRGLVGI